LGERVIVRQNSHYEIEILATDPEDPDSDDYFVVDHVHHLTPYGMLLAGVGACTTVVLHTYAEYHHVALREAELRLIYDRTFRQDCKQCEHIEDYTEYIEYQMVLRGDLSASERKRLLAVSRQCPIHKMLHRGVEIRSTLMAEDDL
jgi:putative redox protein